MTTIAQTFIEQLCEELEAKRQETPALGRFITELAAIDCTQTQSFAQIATPPAVTAHLEPALGALGCGPQHARAGPRDQQARSASE